MKRLFIILGAMFFIAGSAACAQEVLSNVPQRTALSNVATTTATSNVTTEDDVDFVPTISLDS